MKDHKIKDEGSLPDFFVTAMTLDYRQRIDMQSVWQEHIDASISSTVNVPNSFTVEETERLYLYAYERGLKGITIFRDGCKRVGILSTDKKKGVAAGEGLGRGEIIKVNDDVLGKKRKLITGCGSLHCIAPVSYTHLDVYKRQAGNHAEDCEREQRRLGLHHYLKPQEPAHREPYCPLCAGSRAAVDNS